MSGQILGVQFKKYRKSKKMKQADVAKEIGVSTSTYQRIERGEQVPKPAVVAELANIFGISAEEIASAYDKMPDAAFPKSYPRETAKEQIFSAIGGADQAAENSATSLLTQDLNSAVEISGLTKKDVILKAMRFYCYGSNYGMQRKLEKFFLKKLSIKDLLVDTFADISGIGDGKRTVENREIVKIAQILAGAAKASDTGHPEWRNHYDSSYLYRSVDGMVESIYRKNRRGMDAWKINGKISKYGELAEREEGVSFDYNYFQFPSIIIDPFGRVKNTLETFSKKLKEYNNEKIDLENVVNFQEIYSAILDEWDCFYDLRDTYKVLAELQRLQPEESYPELTDVLKNEIRIALKTAADSWR